MNRRDAMKTMPILAATVLAKADSPGVTVRMSEPANLEPAFSEQKTFLTPTDQFYTRSHFATPAIDAKQIFLRTQKALYCFGLPK